MSLAIYVKLDSGTYYPEALDDMSIQQLEKLMDEISDAILGISAQLKQKPFKFQLEDLTEEEQLAADMWHKKAKSALSIHERFRQKTALKLRQKRSGNVPGLFMDLARERLEAEVFRDLLERAKQRAEFLKKE